MLPPQVLYIRFFENQRLIFHNLCTLWNIGNQTAITIAHCFQQTQRHSLQIRRQREKWQSGLGSKFIHQGEKNAAKYADEVIVLSKGVQDYFKETYGRKTHFIPNGVNRPQTREANLITDKFGLKKDSYILFLGRLVPEKGIRYLVNKLRTKSRLPFLALPVDAMDGNHHPFAEHLGQP